MTSEKADEVRKVVKRHRVKPDDELVILGKIRSLLESLPSDAARQRVLSYLGHRVVAGDVADSGGKSPTISVAPFTRGPDFG